MRILISYLEAYACIHGNDRNAHGKRWNRRNTSCDLVGRKTFRHSTHTFRGAVEGKAARDEAGLGEVDSSLDTITMVGNERAS